MRLLRLAPLRPTLALLAAVLGLEACVPTEDAACFTADRGMARRALTAAVQCRDAVGTGVVTEVEIEPSQPCAGEDAVVRVLLAEPDRAIPIVAGAFGNPSVIRFGTVGTRKVPIEVFRDGALLARLEQAIEAIDCRRGNERLVVATRRLAADQMQAVVVLARGLRSDLFKWDFGDATEFESAERSVTHQYPVPGAWASYVISVTARSVSGRTLRGRAHFTAMSTGREIDDSALAHALQNREAHQEALRATEHRVPDRARWENE